MSIIYLPCANIISMLRFPKDSYGRRKRYLSHGGGAKVDILAQGHVSVNPISK